MTDIQDNIIPFTGHAARAEKTGFRAPRPSSGHAAEPARELSEEECVALVHGILEEGGSPTFTALMDQPNTQALMKAYKLNVTDMICRNDPELGAQLGYHPTAKERHALEALLEKEPALKALAVAMTDTYTADGNFAYSAMMAKLKPSAENEQFYADTLQDFNNVCGVVLGMGERATDEVRRAFHEKFMGLLAKERGEGRG